VSESVYHQVDKSSNKLQLITQRQVSPLVGLAIVLSVYIVLAISISQVTPFNKGPDEGINLDYIEFITKHGRLPITYDERNEVGPKSNWPALYHLLVAWNSHIAGVDFESPPSVKVFWDSFRYRAVDIEREVVWHLSTEDEKWPYYGRFLSLHIGRWLSILFSSITLIVVYLVILEVLPNKPWLAVVGVALLAFIPMFIFMGAVLNEDALVAALAAFFLWILVRIVKHPDKLWPYWMMGLAMGLSVTVKYTTVILPLEVLLVLTVITRLRGYTWLWWLKRVAVVGGSAILASSWWFGWNIWFLNEVEELGLISGVLRPIFTGGTDVTMARLGNYLSGGQIGLTDVPEDTKIGSFPGWMRNTFLTFWGVSIGNQLPLSPYIYIVMGLVIITAMFGVFRLWRTDASSRRWLALFIFHVSIFVIAPLVRFGLSRRLGQTAQGRHILIPAAGAIAVLLTWGLATVIPRRWQRLIFSIIIIGFIGWTGVNIYHLATFSPPLLPLRTISQAAEWLPYPVNAKFGDSIELISYDIDPQPEHDLLSIDLAWRSLAHVNENYLLKVTVINEAGEVVSHWSGYNGQGRLPTFSWDPGDSVFDRLILPMPNLPVGKYTVQVQLLGNTGALMVDQQSESDVLSLGEFILSTPANLSLPQEMNIAPDNSSLKVTFGLWQASGLASENQFPSYRYPGTISIVVSDSQFDNAFLNLELVDEAGQAWPATHNEANIYTFVIGPRWQSGDYRLQMTLQEGEDIVARSISQPLLSVENWWKRYFEVPEEIEVPIEANFANQLKFLGYTLPQKQVKAGESFPVTLYWQALPNKAPQADFIQFNHFLDSNGNLQGGYDRQPLEYYSTLLWVPEEVVIDGYAVPVDVDALPGEYFLDVGYYIMVGESAVNLPLVADGEMTDVTSVTIGPVEVIAP